MAIDFSTAPAGAAAPCAPLPGDPAGPAAGPAPAPIGVPAELEALDRIARFTLDLGERAGLPPGRLYRLRLAADELATNIVMHGYRGAPGCILVDGGIETGRVWIRFVDDAPAFDPRQGLRAPELDVPLADRKVGGLGVFLALTAVDSFDYALVAGRNVCTLAIARHDNG
ncbi:ATP-binding protein [Streptomyces sp. NPDC058486]|uniref:ATP-binding protein n=1 Tax=unclassified Streptomyces TaxID=2593676 RepID=UPI003656E6B6